MDLYYTTDKVYTGDDYDFRLQYDPYLFVMKTDMQQVCRKRFKCAPNESWETCFDTKSNEYKSDTSTLAVVNMCNNPDPEHSNYGAVLRLDKAEERASDEASTQNLSSGS